MVGTAVVTGAYGYLGTLLRERLEDAGWATTALVRTPRADDRAIAWSLTDRPPEAELRTAEALVHCAYDFGQLREDDIWRVNVQGTRDLLQAAARAGVRRLLVLSSMSAYAGTRQLYGRSKLAIEEITLAAGGIAVRPGLVYGNSPGGMAGALRALTRLPVVPVPGGDARQFPVHEDDLARVVVEILQGPSWRPEVFGIAQPNPVTFRELLSALAAPGRRPPRFVPVPWQLPYGVLRLAELTRISLPMRSDSLLGLVRPADRVPRSTAFPQLLDGLRSIAHEPGQEGQ